MPRNLQGRVATSRRLRSRGGSARLRPGEEVPSEAASTVVVWLQCPVEGGSKLTTFAGSSRCFLSPSSSSRRSPAVVGRRSHPRRRADCRVRLSGRSSQPCRSQSWLPRLSCRRSWCNRPETSSRSCSTSVCCPSRPRAGCRLSARRRRSARSRRSPVLVALIRDPAEVAVGIWIVAVAFTWVRSRCRSPGTTRPPARRHPAPAGRAGVPRRAPSDRP